MAARHNATVTQQVAQGFFDDGLDVQVNPTPLQDAASIMRAQLARSPCWAEHKDSMAKLGSHNFDRAVCLLLDGPDTR